MNKFLPSKYFALLIALAIFLGSCGDDEPSVIDPVGTEGFFIVNEGGFGNGNTSLSFFDRTAQEVSNNVFATANGIPLGDQAQSMAIHDERGFIVVQNSAKIEVIDEDDFTIIQTITEDIVSPRYFVGLSETKGYVSDWGAGGVAGTVKVIDLTTYEVTKTIPTGQGTNELLIQGNTLYAVNAGGFGRGNELVVIDTNTDEVTQTITLADNPNSLRVDSEGNIWMATSGHSAFDELFNFIPEDSTPGALVKVNPNGEVEFTLSYGVLGGLSRLNINAAGDQLYYVYSGAVYNMSTSASELPTTPFIDESYYGIAVDPINNTIIGCQAPNFSSAGNIDVYSASGDLMNTFTVGIGPNGCTFK